MSNCTVYIDEAGDLGYQRGTQWFILSAVIVDKDDERAIRAIISQIKTRLNVNEIHLKKIPDFMKRAYIVRELESEKFTYMNVVVDTRKLNLAMAASSATAYNYICRMLLERVSWFLRDTNRVGDIVLSARGTARDGELIAYIQNKLLPFPDNQIVPNVFEKVSAKTANRWDLLQLADVCATSTFLAYEINGWGMRAPCYFKVLEQHIYRHNGKIERYGLKYFSESMKPPSNELKCHYACTKRERTPGATTT